MRDNWFCNPKTNVHMNTFYNLEELTGYWFRSQLQRVCFSKSVELCKILVVEDLAYFM